jgi:hypothetical protein
MTPRSEQASLWPWRLLVDVAIFKKFSRNVTPCGI